MSMNYDHEYVVQVLSEISKSQIPLEGHVWCGVVDLDDADGAKLHLTYIPKAWFPESNPEVDSLYTQSFKQTENGIEVIMEEYYL